MRQLNGAAARVDGERRPLSPALTGSAGGRTSSERTLTPGLPAHGARALGRRAADVAGLVAHERDDLVGPGRRGRPPARPSHSPSRTPGGELKRATSRGAGRSVRQHADRASGTRPRRPARGTAPARPPGPVIHCVPSGPPARTVGLRRGQVDLRARLERHRAAAVAEAQAQPVHALGRRLAGVRRAVPAHRERPVRAHGLAGDEALHLVAVRVDDRRRHVVVLAHADAELGGVLAVVAVRGEVERDARDDRDLRRALEALGGEEREERRHHQQEEDGAREEAHRARLRRLVGAREHQDVRLGREGLRLGVQRLGGLDPQHLPHGARRGALSLARRRRSSPGPSGRCSSRRRRARSPRRSAGRRARRRGRTTSCR